MLLSTMGNNNSENRIPPDDSWKRNQVEVVGQALAVKRLAIKQKLIELSQTPVNSVLESFINLQEIMLPDYGSEESIAVSGIKPNPTLQLHVTHIGTLAPLFPKVIAYRHFGILLNIVAQKSGATRHNYKTRKEPHQDKLKRVDQYYRMILNIGFHEIFKELELWGDYSLINENPDNTNPFMLGLHKEVLYSGILLFRLDKDWECDYYLELDQIKDVCEQLELFTFNAEP